jgi:hypothetical protein
VTENEDVAGKSNPSARKSAKSPAKSAAAPIRMIVRRGAHKRFADLKKKTAHLHVEVEWDQRTNERRQEPCLSDSERRRKERRGPPPFTWDAADFVVVTPKSKTPRKIRKPGAK